MQVKYPLWYDDSPQFTLCFTNQTAIKEMQKQLITVQISKYMKGKIKIQTKLNKKIKKLKQEACMEFEVSPQKNILKLFQNQLKEQFTIADYDIKDNAYLYLYDPLEEQQYDQQSILFGNPDEQEPQIKQQKPTFKFTYSGSKYLCAQSNKKFKDIDEIRKFCQEKWQLNLQHYKQINFFYQQDLIYENQQLKCLNLPKQSEFKVILDSDGGNLIKYNQLVNTGDVLDFKKVMSDIDPKQSQKIYSKVSNNIPQKYKKYQQYLALFSYSTQLLYGVFNQDMRNYKQLKWKNYLKLIDSAFFRLKRYIGITYRGIKQTTNYNIKDFAKGKIICQKSLMSSSLNKSVAQNFGHLILEIDGKSGRKLEDCTQFKTQQQVIFLPYTHFEVINVNKQSNHVLLKQIPTIRGNKILFWVDDQPQKNTEYIQIAQKQFGYTVIVVTSTKQAIFGLDKFHAILNFKKIEFKFITDMVRLEGNTYNYYAGIEFIEYVYKKKYLTTKICIFCGDRKRALENCKNKGLTMTQYNFIVESSPSNLFDFIKSNNL